MGDRGYDSDDHRMELSCRDIPTAIARRRTPHGSGLGIFRYVVEQALALFHQFRRLRTRFDKRADIHEAFMTIGCAMICWRRLHSSRRAGYSLVSRSHRRWSAHYRSGRHGGDRGGAMQTLARYGIRHILKQAGSRKVQRTARLT